MNKKQLIHDLKNAAILTLVLFICFEIIFYKEPVLNVLLWVVSIMFLIIIPGFLIAKLLMKDTEDYEKIIFGIMFMIGTVGVLSYYIGISTGNLYYYYIPAIIGLFVLAYFNYFKKN